ncbi:hypothetical protein [uncultured phage cr125_1]|uniref:Uncharacterized protein n=1 Tax=uncultured phage cr125_1 TaxID=2772091 RepID=A0A7M1RUF9_9CAUD|nr:hypothetical protein KNV58_gp018 [uncultured phage cr125_1]QOR57531.1 hypothetical protein [uncultured phage cr125_1]
MMELKNYIAKTDNDLDIELAFNSCTIINPADEVNENKIEEVERVTEDCVVIEGAA